MGRGETADPSTALRSGRDDKGREVTQVGVVSGMGRNCWSLYYDSLRSPTSRWKSFVLLKILNKRLRRLVELCTIQLGIGSTERQQLVMGALFGHHSVL